MIDWFYILKFGATILSMIICDICWAYYLIKIHERKPIAAGLWSVSILLSSAFSVLNYVDDHTLLIAACIGGFTGTFFTIKRKKKKENGKL